MGICDWGRGKPSLMGVTWNIALQNEGRLLMREGDEMNGE